MGMGPPPQVPVGPPPPPGIMGPSPQGLIGPPSDPMAFLDANPDPELYQPPPPGPKPPAASYSKAVRLELHKRMQNQDTLPSSGLNSRVLKLSMIVMMMMMRKMKTLVIGVME